MLSRINTMIVTRRSGFQATALLLVAMAMNSSAVSQRIVKKSELLDADSRKASWSRYFSGRQIHDIFEKGKYVWVSTVGSGVVRLDKQSLEKEYFNEMNSPLRSMVRFVKRGFDNLIWMHSGQFLYSYDNKRWHIYSLPDTTALKYVNQTEFARDGGIWFVKDHELMHFKAGKWKVYSNNDHPFTKKDEFSFLFIDRRNRVWVTGNERVYCLESDTWTVHENIYSDQMVWRDPELVVEDDHGYTWVSNRLGRLRYFDGKQWSRSPWNTCYDAGATDLFIKWDSLIVKGGVGVVIERRDTCLLFRDNESPSRLSVEVMEPGESSLWVGTVTDLFRIHQDKMEPINLANSPFQGDDIRDIKFDPSGIPYVIANGLIYKYLDEGFVPLNPRYPETATTIAFDATGNLYAGGKSYFMNLGNQGWRLHPGYKAIFDQVHVTDIAIGDDGTIWVGTRRGFARFKEGRWQSFTKEKFGLAKLGVPSIELDHEGDAWISTGYGIIQMSGDTFKVHHQYTSGGRDYVTRFKHDQRHGELWMGRRSRGIVVKEQNATTEFDPAKGKRGISEVSDIEFDEKGNVWVSARGGLFYYDRRKWYNFNSSNSSLPGGTINCIGVRNSKEVWIGTDSYGLVILKRR